MPLREAKRISTEAGVSAIHDFRGQHSLGGVIADDIAFGTQSANGNHLLGRGRVLVWIRCQCNAMCHALSIYGPFDLWITACCAHDYADVVEVYDTMDCHTDAGVPE